VEEHSSSDLDFVEFMRFPYFMGSKSRTCMHMDGGSPALDAMQVLYSRLLDFET